MTIPVAIPYSPKTSIAVGKAIADEVITIDNTDGEGIDAFPDASVDSPGEATLSLDENFNSEDPSEYQTVWYTERDTNTNQLKGVIHKEGTEQVWAVGSVISSRISAEAWNTMKSEVEEVKSDQSSHESETTNDDDVHGSKTYSDGVVTTHNNLTTSANDVHGSRTFVNGKIHTGTGTFNSTSGRTISIGVTLANTNYRVIVTPTADTQGYLGEIWVTTKTTSNFVVYNTGSNNTASFDWILIVD